MLPKGASREKILELLEDKGGLREGVSAEVHRQTGVPEADVYGVASFYHLLANPDDGVRVCQGLSCKLGGCDDLKARLDANGTPNAYVSCLGRCDHAPAVWDPEGDSGVGETHFSPSSPDFAIDLLGTDSGSYAALTAALEQGPDWVIEQLAASELTGRGGAGFPAHLKWSAIRGQAETERYIVLNADEGEPGTFKDREVILRRPQLVVEGLAIAAATLGAGNIYCYVRGEFGQVKAALMAAVEQAETNADWPAAWPADFPTFHFVDGHGAYICGEETALLEALEGRRGMPRLRPPYPVEVGFRGKPTLIQNVETVACIPAILERGGEWFKNAGATQAGSKLYCLSGHVQRPGVYEAPLGTTMRELLELAGGPAGTLKAFSPGGASSGFLPAAKLDVAMDFKSLASEGSMLGSAGIVVLNDTVDMVEAALIQAIFFEDESCGQCAPCRIGTQILRQTLERYLENGRDPRYLTHISDVSWGMGEASICGLGQAASLPLVSAMKYWHHEFSF